MDLECPRQPELIVRKIFIILHIDYFVKCLTP